jgi:hypothetical protein
VGDLLLLLSLLFLNSLLLLKTLVSAGSVHPAHGVLHLPLMSGDVGTVSFFEAEIILLLVILHLLISGLIFLVDLLLKSTNAAFSFVLPTLQENVVSKELIGLIKLLFIAVEAFKEVGISFKFELFFGFPLSDGEYPFGFEVNKVFGDGIRIAIVVLLLEEVFFLI